MLFTLEILSTGRPTGLNVDRQLDLQVAYNTQLLLTYSQLGPRAIHFCAWDYVFTRIATDHVYHPLSWHSCHIDPSKHKIFV